MDEDALLALLESNITVARALANGANPEARMFTMTHKSTAGNGDVYQVFRDKAAGVTVTKYTAHRGGCLYAGEISIINTRTCESFEFTSKAPVWMDEHGPSTAASYTRMHGHRIGVAYDG